MLIFFRKNNMVDKVATNLYVLFLLIEDMMNGSEGGCTIVVIWKYGNGKATHEFVL